MKSIAHSTAKIVSIVFVLLIIFCSFTSCSSGTKEGNEPAEPPVRLGAVSDASASLERTYSLASAFELADAVAVVEIKSWLFEDKEMHETFYSAATDRCYKGELPESFTLAQNGCSEITYVDYPLFTVGNKLLLFLNYAENTEYGNLYWIRGSYTTVMDVVLSDSGEEYIADRFGVTGYETRYETKGIDNYAGVKEVYDSVISNLEKSDPILSEIGYEYPYIFKVNDVERLFKEH